MKRDRWPCIAPVGVDAVALTVSVVPNAKRTEAVGLHGEALRVRLAAQAVEGRANDALVAWLSRELRVPQRAVQLKHGAASRRKRLVIECPPDRVATWLDALGV